MTGKAGKFGGLATGLKAVGFWLALLLAVPCLLSASAHGAATDSTVPSTIPNTPFPEKKFIEAKTPEEKDKIAKDWRDQNAAIDSTNAQNASRLSQLQHSEGGHSGGGGGEKSSPPMMMPPPPPPPPPPPSKPPPPPPPPAASQPPPAPPAAMGPAQNDEKNAALEKQIQEQKDLLAQMNSEKKTTEASAAKTQADAEIARIQQNTLLTAQQYANEYAARMKAAQGDGTQTKTGTNTAAAEKRVAQADNRTIAQRMNNASPVGIDLKGNIPGQPGTARAFAPSHYSAQPPAATQARGFEAPPPPTLPPMKQLSASGGRGVGAGSEREPANESPLNLFGAAAVDTSESVHWGGPMIVPRSLSVALEANRAIVGGSSRLKRNVIPQ